VSVVASFYPLAWAAEQVGRGLVSVDDLTPPGVEAHDVTLTARQRAELQTADVVLILGDSGFQPDIERAAQDASGHVVEVAQGLSLLRPSIQQGLDYDPHVWLDPVLMQRIVSEVARGLIAADPDHEADYRDGERRTESDLQALGAAFRDGLADCAFTTFVVTHEAFGYLAAEYGLSQLGIEGLTPESEPSAERIQAAVQAIRDGTAAPAVFYERTDEGERVGESVAGDAGVPALPLDTLEFDPSPLDYLSAMRADLRSLQDGLRCKA
jgi:zinc transport system substrate-binding protein